LKRSEGWLPLRHTGRTLMLYEQLVGKTTEEVCREVAIETHR